MQKPFSESKALQKIASYCAYQERSEKEVRQKLRTWNVAVDVAQILIEKLYDEDFLNEERYARSFVRGKFGLKKWGRNKIRQGLLQNGISENLIQKGFSEIDTEEYHQVLTELAEKKLTQLKDPTDKNALYRFLAQRGFESELITEVLRKLVA